MIKANRRRRGREYFGGKPCMCAMCNANAICKAAAAIKTVRASSLAAMPDYRQRVVDDNKRRLAELLDREIAQMFSFPVQATFIRNNYGPPVPLPMTWSPPIPDPEPRDFLARRLPPLESTPMPPGFRFATINRHGKISNEETRAKEAMVQAAKVHADLAEHVRNDDDYMGDKARYAGLELDYTAELKKRNEDPPDRT